MKTEIAENIGKHAFEVCGLGVAPFRFVGMSESVITYPDGTTQASGSCDYCGTGIRYVCHVQDVNGRMSKVGSDCIAKVGDDGLLKAYKTSPEYRAHQRDLRTKKAKIVFNELRRLVDENVESLKARPHPMAYDDRVTGKPLTLLDYYNYMINACGHSGQRGLLVRIKRELSENKTNGEK